MLNRIRIFILDTIGPYAHTGVAFGAEFVVEPHFFAPNATPLHAPIGRMLRPYDAANMGITHH